MTDRDDERLLRSRQQPLVGSLPDAPGILAAIRLTPGLGVHLRGLADELLVNDHPGATISRSEREMLATAVSAANDCFYCMDSHGAFASAVLERDGNAELVPLVEGIKLGSSDGLDAKMQALLHIARTVRRDALALTAEDVATRPGRRCDRTATSSWPCSSRPPSRCTTGWSMASGRRHRRPRRPTGRVPPRSPSTATATSGSSAFPAADPVGLAGISASAVGLCVHGPRAELAGRRGGVAQW